MPKRFLLLGVAIAFAVAFAAGYFSAGYLDKGISEFSARSR